MLSSKEEGEELEPAELVSNSSFVERVKWDEGLLLAECTAPKSIRKDNCRCQRGIRFYAQGVVVRTNFEIIKINVG